jgi:hypothetical protein
METQEKSINIEMKLNRSMVFLVIACFTLIGALVYFALQYQPADASPSQAVNSVFGLRKFYLTIETYNGANADGTDGNGAGVCATGYHFASLWEIHDPTRLEYNSDLGLSWEDDYQSSDMGKGPPSFLAGWIRTGYFSSNQSHIVGVDNCSTWSSSSHSDLGTAASLEFNWTDAGNTFSWRGQLYVCDTVIGPHVWCVED